MCINKKEMYSPEQLDDEWEHMVKVDNDMDDAMTDHFQIFDE